MTYTEAIDRCESLGQRLKYYTAEVTRENYDFYYFFIKFPSIDIYFIFCENVDDYPKISFFTFFLHVFRI